MRLCLFFLVAALMLAAVAAFGTDPRWGQYAHGITIIRWTFRRNFPIIALAMLCCLAMIALVIAGRRRAWWLVGLAPVLVLFVHRFSADPSRQYLIADNPPLVSVADAGCFLNDDDWVVGFSAAQTDVAMPVSALFACPVVMAAVHDVRCLVLYSPYANRALAFRIPPPYQTKAHDLEIVSMPANALLVFNQRTGQFINGVTGLTWDGQKPAGLSTQIETQKMTWGRWRAAHPATLAAVLPQGMTGPHQPAAARYAMPGAASTQPSRRRVVLIAATQPAAVDADLVTQEPINLSGSTSLLVFRDAATGCVRVFDRRCNGDLFPVFFAKNDTKHPGVAFIDSDSRSEWTADGRAVSGPLEKEHLRPIVAEDDLDWSVIRAWYPGLELSQPMKVTLPPEAPPPTAPKRRSRQ